MHYHRNAKTNIAQREHIQVNRLMPNRVLAKQLLVSHTTVGNWKNSQQTEDHSSRPHRIHYALTKAEERIIIKVRDQGLFTLDELLEALEPYIERLNRSNCYRTLLRYKRNRFSDQEGKKRKQFAQYDPGFLHIDVFYLPRFGPKGKKKRYYCFLAIDRATRLLLLEVYPHKSAKEAGDFLMKCMQFFPFQIHHVLTDNGREFVVKGTKNLYGRIASGNLFEIICQIAGIEHRKTKAKHPWTNGMAERAIRTVKDHTFKAHHYQNIYETIAGLKKFERKHNLERRQRVLKQSTPYQKVLEWYEKKPDLFVHHPTIILERTW